MNDIALIDWILADPLALTSELEQQLRGERAACNDGEQDVEEAPRKHRRQRELAAAC